MRGNYVRPAWLDKTSHFKNIYINFLQMIKMINIIESHQGYW